MFEKYLILFQYFEKFRFSILKFDKSWFLIQKFKKCNFINKFGIYSKNIYMFINIQYKNKCKNMINNINISKNLQLKV